MSLTCSPGTCGISLLDLGAKTVGSREEATEARIGPRAGVGFLGRGQPAPSPLARRSGEWGAL